MGSFKLNKLQIFILSSLSFTIVSYLIFSTDLQKNSLLFLYNFIIIFSLQYLGFYRGIFFFIASIALTFIISLANEFYYFLHIPVYLMSYFAVNSELKKIDYYNRMMTTRAGQVEEKINLLDDSHKKHEKEALSLDKKEDRYKALEDVMSVLNSTLLLDEVMEYIINSALQIIGKTKSIMLFLVDTEKQGLFLAASRIGNDLDKIKAKKGDLLDDWVFKQRQCLIVEDIKKDFRFNEYNIGGEERSFRSVISCPFIAGKRFLGQIRLESVMPGNYTTEDLRLLDILCDLGAGSLQNANLYKKTLELAITDSLTGLYLRRYFLDRLHEELQRSLRANLKFSFLMIDIDNFKNYNDKYGHMAGDIVLRTLSRIFKAMSDDFIISRYGGEEFSILLPEYSKGRATAFAEELRKAVKKEPIELRRVKTHITVSIGVSSFPDDASVIDELILKADERLYIAKRHGKDRVVNS
ncbi:MAG: sensor domain-containing diguanylate cyclase [Candidatus Omnitrophota bacterium]